MESLKREILQSYENVLPSGLSPPPLKKAVINEIGLSRGDPSEKRKMEAKLIESRERVSELEKAISCLKKELETVTSVADIRIRDLESSLLTIRQENSVLKASMNPSDVTHSDDIFRMISREKDIISREKEMLEAEKASLATEKRALQRSGSLKAKIAVSSFHDEMAISGVIAQRVTEYSKKLDGCTKKELSDIRVGLEEMLQQKLSELDHNLINYSVFGYSLRNCLAVIFLNTNI